MKAAARTDDLTSYSTSETRIDRIRGHGTRRRILELVCVFAACYLAGEIGLAVPFTSGNVSPVWPAAGVALAAMIICGYRIWPAVALAAFVVIFFLTYRIPLPPESLWAMRLVRSAALGCYDACRHFSLPSPGFEMCSD